MGPVWALAVCAGWLVGCGSGGESGQPQDQPREMTAELDVSAARAGHADWFFDSSYIHDGAGLDGGIGHDCSDSAHVTHPSLVHAPGGWNSKKFWMAYSPVTSCRGAGDEDPRVICSDDGLHWGVVVRDGDTIANPIFRERDLDARVHYLSDAELFFDGQENLWLMFRAKFGIAETDSVGLYVSCCDDGVTWNSPALVVVDTGIGKGDCPLMSPAIIRCADDRYRMFVVDGSTGIRDTNVILIYASSRPDSGWSLIDTIHPGVVSNSSSSIGQQVWHLDVIPRTGDELLGLFTMGDRVSLGANATLYIGYSRDGGRNWKLSDGPVLQPRKGAWDSELIYRATGYFPSGSANELKVYYSAYGGPGRTWHMGVTTVSFEAP